MQPPQLLSELSEAPNGPTDASGEGERDGSWWASAQEAVGEAVGAAGGLVGTSLRSISSAGALVREPAPSRGEAHGHKPHDE